MAAHQQSAESARDPILVTGGRGFLGRALVSALARRGERAVVLDRRPPEERDQDCVSTRHVEADLALDRDVAARELRVRPVSLIIHLAGVVGVRRVLCDPEGCRAANLALGRALREHLSRLSAGERPRVLAASSSEVYAPSTRPIRESDALRDARATGRWAYAASKLACEREFDESGLWPAPARPVHLRFFNVVGPGQDADQGMMLPRFVEAARRDEPLVVHGDGSQVRTLAHVDDVAETLCELARLDSLPGGPLNVGGTARASVLEIAECVLALSGSRAGLVRVDPRRAVDPRFEDVGWREPDLARLRALGVSVPSRSLEDIVRDTLARHEPRGARRDPCASPAS